MSETEKALRRENMELRLALAKAKRAGSSRCPVCYLAARWPGSVVDGLPAHGTAVPQCLDVPENVTYVNKKTGKTCTVVGFQFTRASSESWSKYVEE